MTEKIMILVRMLKFCSIFLSVPAHGGKTVNIQLRLFIRLQLMEAAERETRTKGMVSYGSPTQHTRTILGAEGGKKWPSIQYQQNMLGNTKVSRINGWRVLGRRVFENF